MYFKELTKIILLFLLMGTKSYGFVAGTVGEPSPAPFVPLGTNGSNEEVQYSTSVINQPRQVHIVATENVCTDQKRIPLRLFAMLSKNYLDSPIQISNIRKSGKDVKFDVRYAEYIKVCTKIDFGTTSNDPQNSIYGLSILNNYNFTKDPLLSEVDSQGNVCAKDSTAEVKDLGIVDTSYVKKCEKDATAVVQAYRDIVKNSNATDDEKYDACLKAYGLMNSDNKIIKNRKLANGSPAYRDYSAGGVKEITIANVPRNKEVELVFDSPHYLGKNYKAFKKERSDLQINCSMLEDFGTKTKILLVSNKDVEIEKYTQICDHGTYLARMNAQDAIGDKDHLQDLKEALAEITDKTEYDKITQIYKRIEVLSKGLKTVESQKSADKKARELQKLLQQLDTIHLGEVQLDLKKYTDDRDLLSLSKEESDAKDEAIEKLAKIMGRYARENKKHWSKMGEKLAEFGLFDEAQTIKGYLLKSEKYGKVRGEGDKIKRRQAGRNKFLTLSYDTAKEQIEKEFKGFVEKTLPRWEAVYDSKQGNPAAVARQQGREQIKYDRAKESYQSYAEKGYEFRLKQENDKRMIYAYCVPAGGNYSSSNCRRAKEQYRVSGRRVKLNKKRMSHFKKLMNKYGKNTPFLKGLKKNLRDARKEEFDDDLGYEGDAYAFRDSNSYLDDNYSDYDFGHNPDGSFDDAYNLPTAGLGDFVSGQGLPMNIASTWQNQGTQMQMANYMCPTNSFMALGGCNSNGLSNNLFNQNLYYPQVSQGFQVPRFPTYGTTSGINYQLQTQFPTAQRFGSFPF